MKLIKPAMGAMVLFCGHQGCFVADIWIIGTAALVRAPVPIRPEKLMRDVKPTHHVSDFPNAGFWRPDLGILCVPASQIKVYKWGKKATRSIRSKQT